MSSNRVLSGAFGGSSILDAHRIRVRSLAQTGHRDEEPNRSTKRGRGDGPVPGPVGQGCAGTGARARVDADVLGHLGVGSKISACVQTWSTTLWLATCADSDSQALLLAKSQRVSHGCVRRAENGALTARDRHLTVNLTMTGAARLHIYQRRHKIGNMRTANRMSRERSSRHPNGKVQE